MFTLCEHSWYSPKLSRIVTSQQLPITPPTEGQVSLHEMLTMPERTLGSHPGRGPTLACALIFPSVKQESHFR